MRLNPYSGGELGRDEDVDLTEEEIAENEQWLRYLRTRGPRYVDPAVEAERIRRANSSKHWE